jgi:hypothetical protein
LSKIQELASLKQPGFFNDNKFDFLDGNFFRREERIGVIISGKTSIGGKKAFGNITRKISKKIDRL